MTKDKILSKKYLTECCNAGHSADQNHNDIVLNDLRKIIYKLVNHICELQGMPVIKKSKKVKL